MPNETLKQSTEPPESGIRITTVRVLNYRCLKAVEAPFGSTTLLIGENNAGKTSFLEALHAAIGSGARQFSEEDLWTEPAEKNVPKDRSIIVDVQIRPFDEKGEPIDVFPGDSPWLQLWGNGVVQDDDGRDLVALRTSFAWSKAKGEYVTERRFLKEWPETISETTKVKVLEKIPAITSIQLSPIGLFLLDAKRDGADDLRSRSSFWSKLVSEPGLADVFVEEIETKLTEINEIFVNQSEVLSHVRGHLSSIGDIVNCDGDDVSITPVARRLRDLNKGMDVLVSTFGASAFPLSRQGMGTRSLASVLLFRAYTSWKMAGRKNEALHPLLAIEEPETHLHPHAQRSLLGQIQGIPGQRIISTHSPYICAQGDIRTFLHFGKSGTDTTITGFDSVKDQLTPEDLRKINREVMNTRGDLLFSRAIVLFEGETEEQSIPNFAHLHWESHPHELGVSFIGVGGSGKYAPFLRLARHFNIPWYIFSDGSAADIKAVNAALKTAGFPDYAKCPNVFIIPNGTDFEGLIAHSDNLDLLREMFIDAIDERAPLHPNGRAELQKKFAVKTEGEIAQELRGEKTLYGARVAHSLSKHSDPAKRIPSLIRNLLDAVRPSVVERDEDEVDHVA